MSNMTATYATDPELIVDRYVAVWNEPEPQVRGKSIAELWAPEGTEFVEGTQFQGHSGLEDRVYGAYREFVESGAYAVTSAGDVTCHHNIVVFTIQLTHRGGDQAGEVAWAARVFLVLGEDGLIHQDYQLTVKPLAVQ